jgi:hypothetical protein
VHYSESNLKDMAMLLAEMECQKEAALNNRIGSYCGE